MSYPRGNMDKRVKLYAPVRQDSLYGQAQVQYRHVATVWAWVTWTRGARAMQNGHMEVYQSIMVRSDIHAELTRYTRLEVQGKFYVIDSINEDEAKNECQVTAFEVESIDKEV